MSRPEVEPTLPHSQDRVTILGVPNIPGVAARVLEEIAAAGIFVDMIVQSYGRDDVANMSFTVPKAKVSESVAVARRLAEEFNCTNVTSSPQVAKLSVSESACAATPASLCECFVPCRGRHQHANDQHQRSARKRRRRRRRRRTGA